MSLTLPRRLLEPRIALIIHTPPNHQPLVLNDVLSLYKPDDRLHTIRISAPAMFAGNTFTRTQRTQRTQRTPQALQPVPLTTPSENEDDEDEGAPNGCCQQNYLLCNTVELPLWAFSLILLLLLVCLITTVVAIWLAAEWPSRHACAAVYMHNTQLTEAMIPSEVPRPVAPDCSICATTSQVPVWITPQTLCDIRPSLGNRSDARAFCNDIPPLATEHLKACVTRGELVELWRRDMCHRTHIDNTPDTWFGVFVGTKSLVNLGFDGHLFCDASRNN